MHEDYDNYMVPVVRDGREGLQSDGATGCNMWLGINDDYMYNLPENTPVDVTVEYYDEGTGFFLIRYDSAEYTDAQLASYMYKESELVYLKDTKQWKSHTFHLEDLKAANRIYNGDLIITTYSPTYGQCQENTIFGSLAVNFGEYNNPLKYDMGTGVVGNLLNDTDNTALCINAFNKDWEMPASFSVNATVYDEKGKAIEEINSAEYELASRASEDIKIYFDNPKKYGLYRIKGKMNVDYKSKNKTITEDFDVKFSVSHTFENGGGDDDFGSCHQIMSYNMGTPEDVAEVYNKAGIAYIRDDINANVSSYNGTKWVLKPEAVEGWRYLKNKGINVIGILFGTKNDIEGLPVTEEQLTEWENWVRDTVTELKGIVDVFEIWNEANIPAFNKNDATPEQYAEMVKRAYNVIKSVSPNAKVMGVSTAEYDPAWTERVLAAGGGDYLDIITIHPYDWSGTFRDEKFVNNAKSIRDLMTKYGVGEKELWATEMGFSTYIGKNSYTRQEQYQNHVLARALSKAYGIYDKYIFYCLADRAKRDAVEENWGIVEWYDADENPYAAKESFVAMTAFSYFINSNTNFVSVNNTNSEYSFRFNNKDLGKDVLLLECHNKDTNAAGGANKTYKLGCTSVDVYDAYGNKTQTVTSENGIYDINFTAEPMYVVGNFTEFEIIDK